MRFARPWRDIRSTRFWWTLLKNTLVGIGGTAALLGLYDVLEPGKISDWDIPPLLILAVALLYAFYQAWPRRVEQEYSRPNTIIRLVEGDLFEQNSHLVVGMTTTFDTQTPDIIALGSVQGQFLSRMYHGDRSRLDQDLASALNPVQAVSSIRKPGKDKVYPLGTIATLERGTQRFFCMAFSKMDSRNNARSSVEDLWLSLSSLWAEVGARGNGEPIAIPVIGGGQSRLSQLLPTQDSIRLLTMSFVLASRRERVCDRLDLVIQREAAKKLNMPELQAFLKAMQES